MTAPSFYDRLATKMSPGVMKLVFNLWAPFRGMKIKVTEISPDFSVMKARMKLGLCNRNFKGVHFGGALFSLADAFHVVILSKMLGIDYIVWDKAARIEYKKPGKGTVHISCQFSWDEIKEIKRIADSQEKYVFDREVDVLSDQNEVVATVTKTLYVRKRG